MKFSIDQEVKVINSAYHLFETEGRIKGLDENWNLDYPYLVAFPDDSTHWFREEDLEAIIKEEPVDPRLKVKSNWKYELTQGENIIPMKQGAIIRNACKQGNKVVIYALVPIYAEDIPVTIIVDRTGHDSSYLGELEDYKDMGTVGVYDETLMWHVFVKKRDGITFSKDL